MVEIENSRFSADFMQAKYCQNVHPIAKIGTLNCSQAWRHLMKLMDKAETNMIWKINRGDCSFWWDNWSESGTLARLEVARSK